MKNYSKQHYTDERPLFSSRDALIEECTFSDGESPLKESSDIEVKKCTFKWKYPLWYCNRAKLIDSTLEETARSGIWYTNDLLVKNCLIAAPKTFRTASNIDILSCQIPNAQETLWSCKNVNINSVTAKGDYFGFHSENIKIENFHLVGNYAFDSGKNIIVKNSILESKDAFWNCENVFVENSTIIGEYLGWNTKNLTLINCKIESHQGMCYIDKLIIRNTEINNSDLIFEYCHNLDVEVNSVVDSIKNPYDGRIIVKGVKELILDEKFVDPSKIMIIKNN